MTDNSETGGLKPIVESLAKPLGAFLTWFIPLAITQGRKALDLYRKLPQNFIEFLIGVIFCFFGGVYPTLFAAVQAAENGGRKTVLAALNDLAEEATIIIEESKKDDKKDDDKDGRSDVTEISGTEFLQRKTLLVLRKMNPDKIDKAIYSIYRVWLAVAAVLTLKFAKTINFALSIAEFLFRPCDHVVTPVLQAAIPDEYDKWVPVVLRWITKSIAISIAWYIQSIQSAFTSALIGGVMIGRSFVHFCNYRGIDLGGLIPAKHEDETAVDEILSYVFAALGFYFQFKIGFKVPSPWNILLWPFGTAEYYIRWSITKRTGMEV
ncbi:expressed unknown protein [Seminavis robusta]|uniref:Uncharacterized protein n=1 Tax=Seminavis robusta TaxID=568900 RepID=A0A9N8EQZ6_9STRA|nr:expressed unknown protein [Seminavis robusta]|eukprot:Sro1830_g300300.1 n/a (322) ;mRNA; f:8345-9948